MLLNLRFKPPKAQYPETVSTAAGIHSYGERRTADEHAEGVAEVAEKVAHGGVPPSKCGSGTGPSAYATFYIGRANGNL